MAARRESCPICSQPITVKKDGTMRVHGSPFSVDWRLCPGTRKRPEAVDRG